MPKYRFVNWTDETGNVVGTDPTLSLLIDKDKTLTAHYEEVPTYLLTINTTAGGTTDPAPGTYEAEEGTTIQVTALPDADYNFNHWILDGVEYTSNPINVVMDAGHTLTAYFSEVSPPPPETYKLNISTTAGGTTDPTPGVWEYDAGVTAIVTAIPEEGYHFNHWELDGETRTENPINITMDKDYTLRAVFSVTPPPKPPITKWLIPLAIIGGIGTVVYFATKE